MSATSRVIAYGAALLLVLALWRGLYGVVVAGPRAERQELAARVQFLEERWLLEELRREREGK